MCTVASWPMRMLNFCSTQFMISPLWSPWDGGPTPCSLIFSILPSTKPNIEVSGWLYKMKIPITCIVYQENFKVSPIRLYYIFMNLSWKPEIFVASPWKTLYHSDISSSSNLVCLLKNPMVFELGAVSLIEDFLLFFFLLFRKSFLLNIEMNALLGSSVTLLLK